MDLIDYLRREIEKSGYPLEIEVSRLLDKRFEVVINTDSYRDMETGETRDIDVRATKILRYSDNPLILEANLVIECKKSDSKAWVFFTRPFEYEYYKTTGQYLDGQHILKGNFEITKNTELIFGSSPHHYSQTRRVAVSFAEIPIQGRDKGEKGGRKEIFEATMQLKKYIVDSNRAQINYKDRNIISISFPCIVFDGKMFEAAMENGQVNLMESNHVVLEASLSSTSSTWDLGFLIDVAHKSYFEEFLSLLDESIESIKKTVEKHSKNIISSVEEIENSMKQ